MFTKTYLETRPDSTIPFWHETPEVQAWLPAFEQKLLEDKLILSLKQTISDDGMTYVREAQFEDESAYAAVLQQAPVSNYQSLRKQYNLNNSITFYSV